MSKAIAISHLSLNYSIDIFAVCGGMTSQGGDTSDGDLPGVMISPFPLIHAAGTIVSLFRIHTG